MHFQFNKKTLWGLVGLILVSLMAFSGRVSPVAAEGGIVVTRASGPVKIFVPLASNNAANQHANYFVAPNGSSSGDGSINHPWSLAYALSNRNLVGGDVVWVRGGAYSGSFTVTLNGSQASPVVVRNYQNERATLVNANSYVLDIYGSNNVYLWGLEIAGNASSRDSAGNPSAYGIRVNQGRASSNVKFINMVIHDVQAMGIAYWQSLTNSEIYGTLFYENGTTKLDHGIYVHNVSGTKAITNNIIVDNASHGIHAYAETAEKGLTNLVMDGNTLFNNGSLIGTYKRNILMGGLTPAVNSVITNNYTYYPGTSGESLNLGYSAGSQSARVAGNYFAGGAFVVGGGASGLNMSGNSIYAPGGVSGIDPAAYPNNAWMGRPGDTPIFVRPNRYEAGRANITIYNWPKAGAVAIPAATLAGVNIPAGAHYELHNAQNFYGDVITGVYDGSAIVVPMTGHSVAQPTGGIGQPASSFPEFGAFILITR